MYHSRIGIERRSHRFVLTNQAMRCPDFFCCNKRIAGDPYPFLLSLHSLQCKRVDLVIRDRSHFKHSCYNKPMQKISTKVFITASILFGIFGMCIVLTAGGPNTPDTPTTQLFIRLMFATVFIILPSLALALASKYLK